MKILNKIKAKARVTGLLTLLVVTVLLCFSGCASNRYNSSKNWNRSPASTGRNRCGCMLKMPEIKVYEINIIKAYAFQA